MEMPSVPTPPTRRRKVTDEQLRACVAEGMTAAAIARQFNCSQANISQRLKQLNLRTVSQAVAPAESKRYVATQIDVMEQLALNLRRANLLMDACDDFLRDARDPTRYDLGPRSGEVDVTYEVEVHVGERLVVQKRKKQLSELLALIEGETDDEGGRIIGWRKGEWKRADPRELILKTQSECRQSVALFADLIQRLMDAETMQAWREAVVLEVAKESPEVACRINERIRRTLVLHAAFADPGEPVAGGPGASLPA